MKEEEKKFNEFVSKFECLNEKFSQEEQNQFQEFASQFKCLHDYFLLGYGNVAFGVIENKRGGFLYFRHNDKREEIGSCSESVIFDSNTLIEFSSKESVKILIVELQKLL
ncbi:MAG: hypothetical protein LBE34_13840 [Flavobacteriaceae bacterium]|jgi:hypothetical protein|nr:hypothetical protein [Flavobacteriaceae bacterium]